MMPTVRLNDATFADLATISTWFAVKTPVEAIDRLVRDAMENLGLERDIEGSDGASSNDSVLEFEKAPGLSYTKLLSATVAGKTVKEVWWKEALLAVIAQVKAKGQTGDHLVAELNIPARVREFEGQGFHYHKDLGISVQYQSAQSTWREIDRLATKWRIPVTVEFSWYHNPKAQHPGKRGRLQAGT